MSKKIAKQTSGRSFRIVQVKSGALVGVTRAGKITDKRLGKRHGVTMFKSWTEVVAPSWAKATKLFRSGKGTKGSIARKAA
jgi:hypothetical protein